MKMIALSRVIAKQNKFPQNLFYSFSISSCSFDSSASAKTSIKPIIRLSLQDCASQASSVFLFLSNEFTSISYIAFPINEQKIKEVLFSALPF